MAMVCEYPKIGNKMIGLTPTPLPRGRLISDPLLEGARAGFKKMRVRLNPVISASPHTPRRSVAGSLPGERGSASRLQRWCRNQIIQVRH